jgi:glycosyltransferase involved in cell wall biosynthesis
LISRRAAVIRGKILNIAICLVNISIGGVWTCLRNIIERLEPENRYSFSVIIKERVSGDEGNVEFLAKRNIPLTLVPKFEVPKPESRIDRRIWKIRRWLHNAISSSKVKRLVKDADLVIDYLDGYFAEELKGLKKPKIFWFHQGAYVWEKRLAKRAHVVLSVFDRIVCLTEGFRKFFSAQYPQYDHKAVTLYNFLDFDAVRKRAQTEPRAVDGPYFAFVGRLSKDKDHDTAIKAFCKFARRHEKVKLVLVGDGPRRSEIEDLIRSAGVEDRIILTGAVDNPYGYVKNSIAHILSTYGEGLPTVLLEAAALEVPNISADCLNGPDEILMNGEAGLLFRPGDADALAEHMSAIWTDRELREKLVRNASRSLDRFSAETVIPRLKSLLELS